MKISYRTPTRNEPRFRGAWVLIRKHTNERANGYRNGRATESAWPVFAISIFNNYLLDSRHHRSLNKFAIQRNPSIEGSLPQPQPQLLLQAWKIQPVFSLPTQRWLSTAMAKPIPILSHLPTVPTSSRLRKVVRLQQHINRLRRTSPRDLLYVECDLIFEQCWD